MVPKVERVGIYFNNHFSGYAVKNSLMLMKELGIQPRNSPKNVKILEIKKKTGEFSKGQTDLGRFIS